MQLFNYYNHEKQPFIPISAGKVGMYVCGPTVYGDPHLGHARSAVVFDVLYRYLQYKGYAVRYVRNITDVGHLEDELAGEGEDKLVKRAKIERREPMEIAHHYTIRYREALRALNVLPPSIEPSATGHIIEQQDYVRRLVAAGWAYEVNGSIYFDLEKFLSDRCSCEYGKLSGKKPDDLLSSQRALVRQEEKRSALDFALWKRADAAHIMKWNFSAREGEAGAAGFPGWHIECSAMSEKYLGFPFDIHGGGIDLQFPHHEAEIAQCCALHDRPPANFWLYNNLITIENRKMSKSLGNFITLEQFFTGAHEKLSRAYAPDVVRFFLLRAQYRSLIDVSDDALFSVARGMVKLSAAFQECRGILRRNEISSDACAKRAAQLLEHAAAEEHEARDMLQALTAHMDDDLDTPAAVAVLFSAASRLEALCKEKHAEDKSLTAFACAYADFYTRVLGMEHEAEGGHCNMESLIGKMLEIRAAVRKEKNFRLSDEIRAALEASGIAVYDNPDGTSSWTYDMAGRAESAETSS